MNKMKEPEKARHCQIPEGMAMVCFPY